MVQGMWRRLVLDNIVVSDRMVKSSGISPSILLWRSSDCCARWSPLGCSNEQRAADSKGVVQAQRGRPCHAATISLPAMMLEICATGRWRSGWKDDGGCCD
ncbi:hypothetical protein Micbo1qcDRAFT_46742 [Microdochium bolleyi]|uniref:Uncharacterized protein n=1 Tax=Microdochium bolleyi TaxID=196109 RepID=A0A136JCK5_9PEZI|nr:hypothetical protein Micbo1qcDRAFT_46742 [Microdochium bolleyi]